MAVLASSVLVAALGVVIVTLVEIGPLSLQMLQHLALMNVLAPIAALLLPQHISLLRPATLAITGVLQMLLLWAWHAPVVQLAISGSAPLQATLFIMLALAALAFWQAVLGAAGRSNWRSLAALMLTGKVACLLGALLIFAPRDLYVLPGLVLAPCGTGPSTLADQQLAGLLMVTACPLSYLVAGVVLAAQMLSRLDVDHVPERVLPGHILPGHVLADGDVAARPR